METIQEIKDLANQRLEDAHVLFTNGKFDGAFYLVGYAVELTLKAKICENFCIPNLFNETITYNETNTIFKGIHDLRKLVKTHNLILLLVCCCLKDKFEIDKAQNVNLSKANGLLFNCWDEKTRYKPCGHKTSKDVEDLLNLLTAENGLLKWIQNN